MGRGESWKEDDLDHNQQVIMTKTRARPDGLLCSQASLSQVEVDSPVRLLSPLSASNGATNWRAAISFRTRSIATSFCRRISQKSLIKHLDAR
jgi:hypothetical protein